MPDTYVTAKVAADMTGHSERTIRRWLKAGTLKGQKTARGDWQIAITDLPAPATRSGHQSDDLAALRRTIEQLVTDLRTLRTRVVLLESQVHRPIAPVSVGEAFLSEHDGATTRYTAPTPPRVSFASPATPGGDFPTSQRGRSRWVEAHGGPKASYVRDWPDMLQWTCAEDAIASVRQRNGWRDWTPS